MDVPKEGCRKVVRSILALDCVAQDAAVPASQFSPGTSLVSILSCSQTECLLHLQNSGISLIAPCLRNQGVISGLCWKRPSVLQGEIWHWSVLFVTGQVRAVLGEGNGRIQLRGTFWAWLYLTFREHFWCFKDIQHFERLLNADIYELFNNFSFYLWFIPTTLGLGIHPWYSQIL